MHLKGPGRGSANSWLCLCLLSIASACGAATANTPADAPPTRAPVSEAHVIEQDVHIKTPTDDDLPPNLRKAMVGYRKRLTNAAARDEELEQLVRRYMQLTREIFRRFRRQHSQRNGPSGYDPLPSWRFQAQASWMLRDLSARATAVRQQLRTIARDQHLDLAQPGAATTRAGRIAMFDKVMNCISEDAGRRADHGQGYLRKASVLGPQLEPAHRSQLLRRELDMMRTTVRCTALASKRSPLPPP